MKAQHIATTIVILITFGIKGYVQEEAKSTCGRRLVNHKALITDGFQTKEGDWPWHAAIYHISTNDIKYKCCGTVLNLNSILTAAHCVFENNRRITAERVYVSLGKHDLILHGTNTQDFRAHKIITHPDFDTSNLRNDIAVIRLKTEAYFNNYVQPICLWDENKVKISEVIGKRGIVIGWGLTEMDELSDTLRQGFMPVVSSIDCLESNRDVFGSFLSNNNFCAGFRNGTSVCNGDSGGSITFEENGIYRIRGIVSLTVSRAREIGDPALCDSKEYVIFTDVAKYLTWIEEVLHMLDPLSEKALHTPDPPKLDSLSEKALHTPDPPKLDSLSEKLENKLPNKSDRILSLPVPSKCTSRPKEFNYRGKNMFLSSHVPALADKKVDWLEGRNICREYCMDLVQLETQEKNNLIFRLIQTNDVPYIWTAGRLCDFKGCDGRTDLEPKNINGWFWSTSKEKIPPTNRIPTGWGYNPWSQTGHKKVAQPDNAEYDINQTSESCLSVLNNVYNDGIAWHDVACYHERPFVCEDSEELLNYVAAINPGIRL